MSRATRAIPAFVAVALAVAGLTACGGASGDVVAQIGGSSINRADLNHWMSTLAGGDFYQLSAKHTIPAGLVSEPPNYGACVARLQAAAAGAPTRRPAPAAAELLSKCRQLYQALKVQALEFLVSAQWTIGVYGEEGVRATDGEVMRLFKEAKARDFPKEGEFQQHLAGNRRSLADELFITKLNVLSQKIQQKLAAGGKQMLAKLTEAGRRWTARANCRAGYVVMHCRQFTGEPAPAIPPPVLMERVAVITGRSCIDRRACAPGK